MIDELHVRNLALIEDAVLRPSPGLTVLTGETGAGKTALLSALKLLAGERADVSQVREGETEAVVEARFTDASSDDGPGDAELIVRRRLGIDGRSRCTVDDEMVTVSSLAARVGPLLELCGQHEHQTLLSPQAHVAYLDRWSGAVHEVLAAYQAAWARVSRAQEAYDEVVEAAKTSLADLEMARFTISEIDRVAPVPGEYESLESDLPALQHAEELAEGARSALLSLRDEGGALDSMAAAQAHLERLRGIDLVLDELIGVLSGVLASAEDMASDLRAYRDRVDFDPHELEQHLDRLGALEGLCKRYGPRMQDVFERRSHAQAIVDGAEGSSERLDAVKLALDDAERELTCSAQALAHERRAHAEGFSAAITQAISELQMPDARVICLVDDLPRASWTSQGPQHIELLFAPGVALTPKPLSRIASGGELSRVMLALKGEVEHVESASTLVFDEVDAGIGGATAVAVGLRLARLARTNQVIVVTHLAQIAVHAQTQVVVSKFDRDGVPVTNLTVVEGEGRVREIARMLAGDESDAALRHARGLLEAVDSEDVPRPT